MKLMLIVKLTNLVLGPFEINTQIIGSKFIKKSLEIIPFMKW